MKINDQNIQYNHARITLTIELLLLILINNVICQNDYYEEMVNTVAAHGDDMLIHTPVTSGINTKLDSLDVICGKEYMTVRAEFNGPFNGIIFSKGTYGQSKCVYVKPHSGVTHATFNVRYDECGTKPDLQGKYFENTIVIQYGTDIIEAYDEAKRLRCEWFEAYEKPATFRPAIPVADLDIIEMNFQGDDIDCWMSIQEGKGPWSNEINRIVTVGQPLTIVVAVNDKKNQFDMKVKSCFAHDGVKSPIYLIDEDGCILRPKMISPFQKIKNVNGKASLISYAQFLAFKFPDSVDVQIQCTVEVCRHGCINTCNDGSQSLSNNLDGANVRNSFEHNHNNNNINKVWHKETKFQIENATAHFVDKDDLLESANTHEEPSNVKLISDEITLGDRKTQPLMAVDDENRNYLDIIADYLQNVELDKNKDMDVTMFMDQHPEPSSTPKTNPMPNEQIILTHHPNEQFNVNQKIPSNDRHMLRPPPPPPPPMPARPAPIPVAPVPNKKLFGEPVAQIMNIPLNPSFPVPPLPLTMQPFPAPIPIKSTGLTSSLSSLLNPFNSIKFFNKKHPNIPQMFSNYFTPKRNYLPNDNFELINNNQLTTGHVYHRTKRYINDQQGEIGLKKGFQVVTTLDLSFSPNMSDQDQMPVFEGKPEAVVYGICFSSTYFIYVISTFISLIFSGIFISIFICYRLEKIKNKNKC